jgi:hypothetical protein
MAQIITINAPDAEHLAHVIAEMQILGAPTIRCVRDADAGLIVALEGSHRIAAAVELGLTPVITLLDDDAEITCDDLGYDDCGWFGGEPARVADIRDRLAGAMGMYAVMGPIYRIELDA